MREEFEKLPKIKFRIERSKASYNNSEDYYECENDNLGYSDEKFLDGAWYAYQEQQEIINEKGCTLTEIEMIVNDDCYMNETMIERIKDLLK